MKRTVAIVSGSRADYGLLKKLICTFRNDTDFNTITVATGSHLSEKHGKTINLIREDFPDNVFEVDMKIDGDQARDISYSLGYGAQGFADIYEKHRPDFIVVLGDRYELWSACMSATLFNIPIVHIHGGETTRGVIDEVVRHSVTKMAHLHFSSHDTYKKRITQMGENSKHVHVVGAVGLDRISEMKFLTKAELEKHLEISFAKKNVLCTFHPVTLDKTEAVNEAAGFVDALEQFVQNTDCKVFLTSPNADTNSAMVRNKLDKLIQAYPQKIRSFVNMGDHLYLSLMKVVDLILGNSSSGIIEAPFLNKAVVNVGRRQEGRLTSDHVIHVKSSKTDILSAIEKALSEKFQNSVLATPSIYGNGNATTQIYEKIKKTDFTKLVFKTFVDGVQQ